MAGGGGGGGGAGGGGGGVERLRAEALQGRVTLLIAGHDRNRTHARVLREAILGESDPDLPR